MDVWCSAEATEAHYRDGTSPGDGTEASPFSLIEALTASDIHGIGPGDIVHLVFEPGQVFRLHPFTSVTLEGSPGRNVLIRPVGAERAVLDWTLDIEPLPITPAELGGLPNGESLVRKFGLPELIIGGRPGNRPLRAGGFMMVGGQRVLLAPYWRPEDIFADTALWDDAGAGTYVGPGVFVDDEGGRPVAYVRVDRPTDGVAGVRNGDEEGVGEWLAEWQPDADIDLHLAWYGYQGGGPATVLAFQNNSDALTSGYLTFERVHFYNSGGVLLAGEWNDLTFRDCHVDASGTFITLNSATGLRVEDTVIDGHLPHYVSWDDIKTRRNVRELVDETTGEVVKDENGKPKIVFDPPPVALGTRAITVNAGHRGLRIERSVVRSFFDGIFLADGSTGCAITETAVEHTHDDGIQLGTDVTDIEIADNHLLSCYQGVTRQLGGRSPKVPCGRVWIHHNILRLRPGFHRRERADGEPFSRAVGAAFSGTHGTWVHGNAGDVPPWKIYQNTVDVRGPRWDQGLGSSTVPTVPYRAYAVAQGARPTDVAREVQEVYGNIFIQDSDRSMFDFRIAPPRDRDFFDGNLYYHLASSLDFDAEGAADLAAFRDGRGAETTLDVPGWGPGPLRWEQSGADFNIDPLQAQGSEPPVLDPTTYRPSQRGPAATSRLVDSAGEPDLAQRRPHWPGSDRSSYVGAVPSTRPTDGDIPEAALLGGLFHVGVDRGAAGLRELVATVEVDIDANTITVQTDPLRIPRIPVRPVIRRVVFRLDRSLAFDPRTLGELRVQLDASVALSDMTLVWYDGTRMTGLYWLRPAVVTGPDPRFDSEFDRNGSTYVFHPQEATAGWA